MKRVLILAILLSGVMAAAHAGAAAPAATQPKGPVRVFHFMLRAVTLDKARWMTSEARKAGFNTLQVVVTDGVRLDRAPWKPRPDAWTKAEFLAWVEDARRQGMEVVPEVKLLTHQHLFMQVGHAQLMFNRATYDPRKEETYGMVLPLLDEIIDAVRPKAVHIGHDEVAGHGPESREKWLRPGDSMLPADLFLRDVLRVHEHLKQRGVQTWMWGDMLISPSEFPGMQYKDLHGAASGYGKALRDRLPKDIVICDWHYFDEQAEFPSLSAMQREGFRVIGATWMKARTIQNFSRYAAQHRAYGMMATTWATAMRKEWAVVEQILQTSGAAFLKDFPDAR